MKLITINYLENKYFKRNKNILFIIRKSILHEIEADINSITYKDVINYFGILIDGNIRKWICRLHFNTENKYISFPVFEENGMKSRKDNKILLENGINDIYKYKELLKTSYKNNK